MLTITRIPDKMKTATEVKKISDKEDLSVALSIRRKVFVEEQGCPPELEWENDDVSIHFIARYNGHPAGAARWRKTENGYKLERFAVLKEFRGKKVGTALVNAVLSDLPSTTDTVYLNAQLSAVDFYITLGFQKQGSQFEEAGIQHYKMIKALNG